MYGHMSGLLVLRPEAGICVSPWRKDDSLLLLLWVQPWWPTANVRRYSVVVALRDGLRSVRNHRKAKGKASFGLARLSMSAAVGGRFSMLGHTSSKLLCASPLHTMR